VTAIRRREPRTGALLLLLALLTLAAFRGVLGNGFVPFDDAPYVTANRHVLAGPTLDGAAWAFTSFEAANWHPLTWLSHMADVGLFGLAPAGHHATSLALHVANACLLFLVLAAYTGARWPSAFAAALFAVHPLHVESVAWVAERKDVLSTLFGLLALAAYRRHAARPGPGRLLPVGLLLAFSLMAKPMLVTLPFLLLLLDWWPLGRVGWRAPAALSPLGALREKLPLLALAAAAAAVTLVAQERGQALLPAAVVPGGARLGNALLAYLRYLGLMVRPVDLAVYYPHPLAAPPWRIAAAAAGVLAGVTALAARLRRRHPWVLVGWCWYLGTLVPVIGLVQAGSQAMADRYTYLPLVGPFLAIAWAARRLSRRLPRPALLLGPAAALCLAALAALTAVQVGFWRDGDTLFGHALRVTRDNWMAHNNLGTLRFLEGRTPEAIVHYAESVRINPGYPVAQYNYGNALAATGDLDGAVARLETALRLDPGYGEAANNLGNLLLRLGRTAEAIGRLRAALAIDPALAPAHASLANAYVKSGRPEEALPHFREAVRLQPGLAAARVGLGLYFAGRGRWQEAEEQFAAAVRIDPGDAFARYNLEQVRRAGGRVP
jgi:tetratricopeptide (TPR) repeat protein